jgi:hypothetical protein
VPLSLVIGLAATLALAIIVSLVAPVALVFVIHSPCLADRVAVRLPARGVRPRSRARAHCGDRRTKMRAGAARRRGRTSGGKKRSRLVARSAHHNDIGSERTLLLRVTRVEGRRRRADSVRFRRRRGADLHGVLETLNGSRADEAMVRTVVPSVRETTRGCVVERKLAAKPRRDAGSRWRPRHARTRCRALGPSGRALCLSLAGEPIAVLTAVDRHKHGTRSRLRSEGPPVYRKLDSGFPTLTACSLVGRRPHHA